MRLNKYMYGMNNYVKIFDYELTDWLIYESGFNQYKCQMPVYYQYEPDGSKLVVLSCTNNCVYRYTYEELGKWFLDTLGNIFHVKFLGY